MGLINILLGAKKGARTIAEIEAALARLVSERNIAKEAIASALAERDSLLLEDESDARIGKLDTSTDKARLTVERCDKLEPILLRELATVKGAAKAAKWQELRSRYDSASTDFVHKARAAIAALESLSRIRGEAQGTGFAVEAATFAVAPNILKPDLLAMFEFEIERQRDAGRPKPAPAPKPLAPPPAKQAPAAPKAKAPALKAAAPVTPRPAPEPRKPVADEQGRRRVVFLKAGYSLPDGLRPKVGDVVALSADVALDVVRATVAEFEQSMEVAL